MDNQNTKILKVKEYLLTGKQLTGLELMLDFGCLAYRDVIYKLRKKGLEINSRMVGDKTKYAVYWMDYEDINKYQNSSEITLKGGKDHGR